MNLEIIPAAVFIMIGVGALGLFGFLAVERWAHARRREREAFYRNESIKKIAETQGAGAASALELFREQERSAAKKIREHNKLAGLICVGVGTGLMIFLKGIGDDRPDYLVGLIPTLAGVALMIYAFLIAPKE
jgi:hypothetical protein